MEKTFENTIHPMAVALVLMDMGYFPDESENAAVERRKASKKHKRRKLSRKAQISKRRKISVKKDRKNRKNEALNAGRREFWRCENLGWLNAAPIKERKLAIRAKYLLGETELEDVE